MKWLLWEALVVVFYMGTSWTVVLMLGQIPLLWKVIKKNSTPMPTVLKETKYLALQTQINPHFLYNTLEGIRSEALISGAFNAARMSELLGRFFRYNISNLSHLATIEEELNHLDTYFQIQMFRFEERIQLKVHFDGDKAAILKCPTPKLTLQPLVENAIHHGLEPLTRPGTVTLRFQMYESVLVVVISDDGVGMEPEKVTQLNAQMKQTESTESSIGLENVNQRIQLLFGQEWGLHFYSQKGHGTDVELTLPVGDS